MSSTDRVLADLAKTQELPEIIICARRQAQPMPVATISAEEFAAHGWSDSAAGELAAISAKLGIE